MAAERATFEEVLALARALSRAEQARLVARLAPALAGGTPGAMTAELGVVEQLPADSPAGRLARDPASALGRLMRLVPADRVPSEEELARWREERLAERYGA